MPAHDLDLLTHAALDAGKIALAFWKNNPRVWDKDGTPVTEADIAVNDMLQTRLCGARPDYGWLSEETPDTAARLSCEHVFIIDPIDGTRSFVAGEDTFAHSLAIARNGVVIAGVVYLPALDRLYTASLTAPAMRDGQPIAPSGRAEIDGATLLTSRPNLDVAHWPRGVPPVKRTFRASFAYRMCLVAEGRHDAMLTLKDAWEWDIAAGALICTRAGAVVSDRAGDLLPFNRPHPQTSGVIAATPVIHQSLLAQLHPQAR